MTLRSTGFAICIYVLSLLLFDLMGLIIKYLSTDYAAQELSAYRNLFGLIPSMISLATSGQWKASGRPLRMRQWKLAAFRGLIVAVAQLMFYLSLGQIAFATAATISYSGAFFMVIFAVPLLGEKVGPVRWVAVIVGAVGVVMVTGIGKDAFTVWALLPVGAAACYSLSGVTSRMVDEDVPSALLNLHSSFWALLGALALAVTTSGFSPLLSLTDLGLIVAMGCFGGSAVLALIISMRIAEQATLAPFSYFGIPLAFGLGWLFFGETPISDLFPGALVIALAGLLIIWRERQLHRQSRVSDAVGISEGPGK